VDVAKVIKDLMRWFDWGISS